MGRRTPPPADHAARAIRQRIERGGERVWRLSDFAEFPPAAVAQALSRLRRSGVVERLSKGVYYRSKPTTFGRSLPNPLAVRKLAASASTVFPSGLAAANLLGFTTQVARRPELATDALSLPRKLVGSDAIIHTRRPAAWRDLSVREAALLDFLRRGGRTSELSAEATIQRTLAMLGERNTYTRLLRVAADEPPRVRALLGALGAALGKAPRSLRPLKDSLNPLSRFEFGLFAGLPAAEEWQAKKRRR